MTRREQVRDAALSTPVELRSVTTSTGVHRLSFLDGIRGLAAVYVVISHVWDTVFTRRTPAGAQLRALTGWLGFGRYAVAVFIVISGFSIGLGAWKGGLRWPGGARSYLRRRVTRIFPPYAIAVLVSSLLAGTVLVHDDGTLFDQANQIRLSGVLTHLALVQDIHWAGPAGSTAFWSVPVEFHIYFFFLLVLAFMRRRLAAWRGCIAALMVLTAASTLLPGAPLLGWLGGLSPSLYALFVLGVAGAASAAAGARFEPQAWRRFLLGMFLAGCFVIAVCHARWTPLSPLNDFLLGPLVALLITELASGRLARLRAVLSGRVAVWLGDCSYSIYLIHAVVIEIVWRVAVAPATGSPTARLLLELVLGVGASVLAGRLFFHAFERPFLRVHGETLGLQRGVEFARSRLASLRVRVMGDRIMSGSAAMLLNTAILAAFGYLFAVIASRSYPASAVGTWVAFNAGATLLGTVAGLGWSVSFIRFLPRETHPRMLIALMTGSIVLIGGAAVLALKAAVGSGLLRALHLASPHSSVLFPALVLLTALGSVTTPGLVSLGALRALIVTDLIGACMRVGLAPLLAPLGGVGLLLAYTIGTGGGLLGALAWMWRIAPPGDRGRLRPGVWWPAMRGRLRTYYSYAGASYATAIVSVIPGTCIPLIVGAKLGARDLAWFGMAANIASLLTVIPATVSQAYLVEANRDPARAASGAFSAVKVIYAVLGPAAILLAALSPLVLHAMGAGYADHGAPLARVLALNSLVAAMAYVIEASLAGTARLGAYVGLNVFNAAFVFTIVLLAASGGLVHVGLGLMIGNAGTVSAGAALLLWNRHRTGSSRWRVVAER